jgi:hypothetical protein
MFLLDPTEPMKRPFREKGDRET